MKKMFIQLWLLIFLPLFLAIELNCSNVISLSSFKKGYQEVHLVGDEARYEGFENKCFDFNSFLQKCNGDSIKTGILFFDKDPETELSERIEFHSASQKGDPYYSLRERLLQIALGYWDKTTNKVYKPVFTLENLNFLKFSPDELDSTEDLLLMAVKLFFENDDALFLSIFKKAGLTIESIDDFQLILDLDEEQKKIFFNPKASANSAKTFNCVKAYILSIANKYHKKFARTPIYNNFITNYNKKINALLDNSITIPFKKRWNTLKDRAYDYLTVHNPENKNISLCEIFFKVTFEKKSFLEAYEEFEDMLIAPVLLVNEFKTLQLLLEGVASYDRILCFNHFANIKEMANVLQDSGFKEEFSIGMIPEKTDGKLAFHTEDLKKRIIAMEKIESFFTSILKNDAKNDDFYIQNSTSSRNDNSIILYFKEDISSKNCYICTEFLKAYDAFALTESEVYCSAECLLTKLFQGEKAAYRLSKLLDEKHNLSDDQKLVLKQFGALCYLRTALLMPSLVQEYGIVYQLGLDRIINLLEKIEAAAKETISPWGQTLELALYWGIKIVDLKLSLGVYKTAKHNYLQKLLQDSLKSSYETLNTSYHTYFDENGLCIKLQKVAYAALKKTLGLSDASNDISVIFLYNKLIEKINERVGLSFDSIEDLLGVTYKDQDIVEVLKFICYTENPCAFTKKEAQGRHKKEKKKAIVLSDKESPEDKVSLFSKLPLPCSLQTAHNEDKTPFTLVEPLYRRKIRTIKSLFAGSRSYTITLFKARKYVPRELQEPQAVWKTCEGTTESFRIKILFALADSLENQKPIIKLNFFGCPVIECDDENYDKSIREKLDLHHLFTRSVDTFLSSYGVAEQINNLIQVSIPGEITDHQGIKKVGFFQYSFTPSTWVCIHRCFKPYDANQNNNYISPVLRKILYDYLTDLYDNDEYSSIINHLKQLLKI